MAANPIKTGVIGYGLSAKIFHLPFILSLPELFTLHSIVQRSPVANNDASADFSGYASSVDGTKPKFFRSTEEMLADPDVELIVITTIPSSHYEIVTQALNAGKHVLCEKPFVATSREAAELGALAKTRGKVLCVYQNRRYDGDYVLLKELVHSNALGRVVEVASHFDRHRPEPPTAANVTWKARNEPGNGAIYDLGTHLLDQLIDLLGAPETVTGFITNQRQYGSDGLGLTEGGDSFTVLLGYPSKGVLATAKAGVVSAELEQLRFWARGEKGSWKKFNLDPQEDQLKAGVRPPTYHGPVGKASEDYGLEQPCGTITSLGDDGAIKASAQQPHLPPKTYVEFYRDLSKAIRGNTRPPVPAEDAVTLLKVIEAVQESSSKGVSVTM